MSARPFRRRKRKPFDHGKPISRIDIRPVGIFAVILAMLAMLWNLGFERTHTLLIDLPFGMGADLAPTYPYVTVEVFRDGRIAVDGKPSSLTGIAAAIADRNLEVPTVLFSPEPDTDYGTAALVLNEITKAGVLPSEICFDRLKRFRDFEKISFRPVVTILESDEETAWGVPASDVLPSGCEQFFEPYYEAA